MNSKIKWLRNKLNGLNMQGMIVTNPVNIKYLTNIEAEGILLITRKENIFLTDSRYIEHVNAILTIEDGIVVYNIKDLMLDDYENFFMVRRRVVSDHSFFQKNNVFCDKLNVRHDVCGDQNDFVKRDFCNVVPNGDSLLGVQTCGWLVENEDLRIPENRLCECQSLLHSAGQRTDLSPWHVVKLHGSKDGWNVCFRFFFGQAFERSHVPHEPLYGKVRIQSGILRHETELFPETDAHFENVFRDTFVTCIPQIPSQSKCNSRQEVGHPLHTNGAFRSLGQGSSVLTKLFVCG